MTLLPFADCCLLLGVDPKTLRLWLTSARVSCTASPTDARLKCLTPPQLHHLAELHGRLLPDPLPGQVGPLVASLPVAQPASSTACGDGSRSPAPGPDTELRYQLTLLQTHVATLQEQVTQLALALVREQQWHWQQCATLFPTPSLFSLPNPSSAPASPPLHRTPAPAKPKANSKADRPRSRALPLIEYGADGTYVVISPDSGVLSLLPDSPAWFSWLTSLTAFAFQGKQGRFSATRKFRDGQRLQSWNVHRSLHGRSCNLYLGLTPTLTLARLEDMAAAVYARLTSL